MDKLCEIKDKLIDNIYTNIDSIPCDVMGKMIDMIKDICEAKYYHSVTKTDE